MAVGPPSRVGESSTSRWIRLFNRLAVLATASLALALITLIASQPSAVREPADTEAFASHRQEALADRWSAGGGDGEGKSGGSILTFVGLDERFVAFASTVRNPFPEGWAGELDTLVRNLAAQLTNDDDRDGIPNDRDVCPGTPAGEAANPIGCPAIVGSGSQDEGQQWFVDAHARNGGIAAVGSPTSEVYLWVGSSSYAQHFEGGSDGRGVMVTNAFTESAYWIHGAFIEEYTQPGSDGPAGVLGPPKSDVVEGDPSPFGTTGQYVTFEGTDAGEVGDGSIHWIRSGAHAGETHVVRGALYQAWQLQGSLGGELGYPVSNEQRVSDSEPLSGIIRQEFEGDSIEVGRLLNVASPVYGPLAIAQTGRQCGAAYSNGQWCFNQHETGWHGPSEGSDTGTGGIRQADETWAWDANLNPGDHNLDAGRPVLAVADGHFVGYGGGPTSGTSGELLIEHDPDEQPGTGDEWWSGYLHLDQTPEWIRPGEPVAAGTQIGIVGHVSTDPNMTDHLHFVTYRGLNETGKLRSVDALLTPRIDPTDVDSDGLLDAVDRRSRGEPSEPDSTFSSVFSDEHLGGRTHGTVVDRGGLDVIIDDDPVDGVVVSTGSHLAQGSPGSARIDLCGEYTASADPGTLATETCGDSLTSDVQAGQLRIELHPEIVVVVFAGARVMVDSTGDQQFDIENSAHSGGAAVLRSYGQEYELEPGRVTPVGVDTSPPLTAVYAEPPRLDGANGWWATPVTVSLFAEDEPLGSGVGLIEYRLGGEAWQPYAGPFATSLDGTTIVQARATDNAGNVGEPVVAVILNIDRTGRAPAVIVSRANQAVQGSVALVGAVADATSSTASVLFSVQVRDGRPVGLEDLRAAQDLSTDEWKYEFDSTQLPDGDYQVLVMATDSAGNDGWREAVRFSVRN